MESYIGSYNFWGIYRAVIMPPNFPLDKMENPLLNFFSPAIMSGDMSDMNVVMNSMAHSWFGNTITCKNWTNIWINDGISTFLERKTENLLFG